MSNDLINGLFELAGALFIINNIRLLLLHKQVKGVSALSTLYFTSWGLWNLYYYPSLNQPWSFWGAVALSSTNAIWVGLMIYYNYKARNDKSRISQTTSD